MDVSSLHVHPLGDDQEDEYAFKRRFGDFLFFSSFACVLVGFATRRQNNVFLSPCEFGGGFARFRRACFCPCSTFTPDFHSTRSYDRRG